MKIRFSLLTGLSAAAAVATLLPVSAASAAPAAAATSTIEVHLTYADGVVAHPARAFVQNVSGGTADSAGHALITLLPPRSAVQVCGDDLGPRADKAEWPGALNTCVDTVTPAAGATAVLDLRLQDAASVKGAVRLPNGRPAAFGYAILQSVDDPTFRGILDVDDQGRIESGEFPPGRYTVCGSDFRATAHGCVGGAFFQEHAAPIDLTAGTYTPVDVSLLPAFSVGGQVTAAADGSVVPDATVEVRSATGTVIRRLVTTSVGTWGSNFLPMSTVSVCVTPIKAVAAPGQPAPTGLLPGCVTYRPSSTGQHTLDLALDAGGAIDGAVVDQAGRPVGGGVVELWKPSTSGPRRARTVATDLTGRWTTGILPAGDYIVCFRAVGITTATAPHGYQSRCWADRAYVPANADTVTVATGSRTGPVVGRLIAKP